MDELEGKVAVSGLGQRHLDETVDCFAQHGLDVHSIRLDVTDRAGMERAADEIEQILGPVQLLANNAGIGLTGPVGDARPDDWDWMIDVKIKGVVNGVPTFLPRMQAHGDGGHIVNTSSMSGILPHAGADSGYPAPTQAPDWSSLMGNLDVGERVLSGVRANALFILSHAEFRAGTQQRCDTLMASFSDEEPDARRLAEFTFLMSNSTYQNH